LKFLGPNGENSTDFFILLKLVSFTTFMSDLLLSVSLRRLLLWPLRLLEQLHDL
jgi:hypothetical protein